MTKARHRTVCVIDVETAPRDGGGEGDGRARADKLSNHRLTCATVLLERTRAADPDAMPTVEMLSFDDSRGEASLIAAVEAALPSPGPDGTLVSFNGIGHDLVALRSRAMANWLFDCPKLKGWVDSDRHLDLMLALSANGRGRWPSLVAACSALSIPAKMLPRPTRRTSSSVLLMNQCDVAATYLLHLHLAAFEDGSALTPAKGWVALADAFGRGKAANHPLPYADHPCVIAADRLLADRGVGTAKGRRRTALTKPR